MTFRSPLDQAESAAMVAKLHVRNARTYADWMSDQHGAFSAQACEARLVERAARERAVAALDVSIELCAVPRAPLKGTT